MDQEGRRPGGLTALAVLNFVFGGAVALSMLVLIAILGAADQSTRDEITAEMAKEPAAGLVWISLLLSIVTVGLMIASGVGYLGQKRFLGRTLGNAYALTSLVSSAIGIAAVGFGIGTIIGLVYPVLTLALINTTFKDDLVH
jgi:hypothetical protein